MNKWRTLTKWQYLNLWLKRTDQRTQEMYRNERKEKHPIKRSEMKCDIYFLKLARLLNLQISSPFIILWSAAKHAKKNSVYKSNHLSQPFHERIFYRQDVFSSQRLCLQTLSTAILAKSQFKVLILIKWFLFCFIQHKCISFSRHTSALSCPFLLPVVFNVGDIAAESWLKDKVSDNIEW